MPGIINAHGHADTNRDPPLRQYALDGVTTTTSMAFDPDDVDDITNMGSMETAYLGGKKIE